MTSEAPHALIAGAGIGGLTAALCLARAGFRVSLLERAKLLDEIGAGLQMSPNASAILHELGVLPRFIDAALAPEALVIRRAHDGRRLQRLSLTDAQKRWGAPYLLVHRADLQKALLESVAQEPAITLALQCELAGFAADPDGVTAAALHGKVRATYSGDCLIGADGLRSFVRQRLANIAGTSKASPPILPNKSSYVAWRCLIDAENVAPEMRRAETTLWLGPGAHLVHYPLRGGSVVNLVAVIGDKAGIDWKTDIWSQNGAASDIKARFANWHKDSRALIDAGRDWRKWPLADLDPLPAWVAGRVALLGDAAHPMLPFLAQGAAQAIEDAAALGRLLAPRGNIAASLAAYEAARRARASRVQGQSRRQGHIYHLGAPVAIMRDLALATMGPKMLLARYDWLYDARTHSVGA